MATEAKLWQSVKGWFPQVHWQRIETFTTGGVPDLNGCHQGVDFWLELKVITGLKRPVFQSEFKGTQYAWMIKRMAQGGICHVLGQYFDELWLWSTPEELKMLVEVGPGGAPAPRIFRRPLAKAALLSAFLERPRIPESFPLQSL